MFIKNEPAELPFSLSREMLRICARAQLFSTTGKLHIWIYFIQNRCHLHCIEMSVLQKYYVAHYKCEKLLKGLSKHEWKQLESKIAQANEKEVKSCRRQKH